MAGSALSPVSTACTKLIPSPNASFNELKKEKNIKI